LQVDPSAASVMGNDDEASWCDGVSPFGAGDLGTPGTANAQCAVAPTPGTCTVNGTPRAIMKPAVGNLVITEIMPNPKVEPGQEWFEITNISGAPFDLNELGLDRVGDTRPPDIISSTTCKVLGPGAYAVLARSLDPAINDTLPTPAGSFGFSMVNTSGELRVLDGTTVLDAVSWTTSTDGVSSQLDPDLFTTSANDLTASFCASTTTYGSGVNKGTPGAANAQCP
jgi:hypothetical protein